MPHALALGVEQKWAEQFADVFAKLREQGTDYVPVWYVGHRFSTSNISDFSSSLGGAFASAVASSATAPGSSSGFGGGGGGGGW